MGIGARTDYGIDECGGRDTGQHTDKAILADLISFDIDGTLEVGEPRGSVTIEFVRTARRNGSIIGSCSDRPLSHQRRIWERLNVDVDFTALKDRLDEVKARFDADSYTHVGDTDVDEHFANKAGFEFVRVDTAAYRAWSARILNQGAGTDG